MRPRGDSCFEAKSLDRKMPCIPDPWKRSGTTSGGYTPPRGPVMPRSLRTHPYTPTPRILSDCGLGDSTENDMHLSPNKGCTPGVAVAALSCDRREFFRESLAAIAAHWRLRFDPVNVCRELLAGAAPRFGDA